MYFPNFMSIGEQAMAVSELINTRLKRLSNTGIPQEEFLYSCINEYMKDPKREMMLTAQNYFQNDNDIIHRERYYIDRKGIKQKAENLSNNKLAHPYMKKFVNQKINYLLAKPFTVQCEDEQLLEVVKKALGKKFKKMLKNVGKHAIIDGISWVQVYYDLSGKLGFKRLPADEIIPFWADADHTVLEGLIRFYTITQYLPKGETKQITKVEYYTLEGVWYYIMEDDGLVPDPDKGEEVYGHFAVERPVMARSEETGEEVQQLDEEGNPLYETVQSLWDKIPFIAFKYNAEEISLLKWVKPLIDDYDLNTSDTSNVIQDVPNSIKVVKNYDGTDKDEFTHNLNVYRTAFVTGDGDMSTLETKLDIDAIDKHLDRTRKDLYEAASCVDTQVTDLGNASGVALKFRYADLDMDCGDMANEFTSAMDELLWFVKVDLTSQTGVDYTDIDIDIIFNTDVVINETEVIDNASKSVGIISDETILANHPWVEDAEEELEKVKKQQEEQAQTDLQRQEAQMDLMSQYGDDNNEEDDTEE